MKIFATPKKQDRDYLASTQGRFFRQPRRLSQSGTINEMFFNQKLNQNIIPLRQLSHFKKNNNKVQCNIQQGKKDNYQCNFIGRRKMLRQLNSNQFNRRSWNGDDFKDGNKSKNFRQTCINKFYKPAKLQTPSDIIKQNKIYPRYRLLQLYALYRSIIQYSERDPKKFLHSFESALNYQKIMIRSDILKKNLFESKSLQFKDFLLIFKKMQDLMFIQSIIDYLEIIFEAHCTEMLKYRTVYEILMKRSTPNNASIITDIIFKKLSTDKDGTVELHQIIELCEKDIQFCSTFSKLYHHQTKDPY